MKYINEVIIAIGLYVLLGSVVVCIGGPENLGPIFSISGVMTGAILIYSQALSMDRLSTPIHKRKPLTEPEKSTIKKGALIGLTVCTAMGALALIEYFQEFSFFMLKLSVFMGSLVLVSLMVLHNLKGDERRSVMSDLLEYGRKKDQRKIVEKVLFIDDQPASYKRFSRAFQELKRDKLVPQTVEVIYSQRYFDEIDSLEGFGIVITDYQLEPYNKTGLDILRELPKDAWGVLISALPERKKELAKLSSGLRERVCFIEKMIPDFEERIKEVVVDYFTKLDLIYF